MLPDPRLQTSPQMALSWYRVAASNGIDYQRFHTVPKQPHASQGAESKYSLSGDIGDIISMFLEDESMDDLV